MIRLICPACSAPNIALTPEGSLECQDCGSTFIGEPQNCPSCGHENAFNVEACRECGEPLTIFGQVMTLHHGKGFNPLFLQQARAKAARLKERESIASQNRLQSLQDIDNRRIMEQAKAHAARKAQDRKTFIILSFILLMFIIFVVAFVSWKLIF